MRPTSTRIKKKYNKQTMSRRHFPRDSYSQEFQEESIFTHTHQHIKVVII